MSQVVPQPQAALPLRFGLPARLGLLVLVLLLEKGLLNQFVDFDRAQAATGSDASHAGRIATARFFAENILTAAAGLEATITGSAQSVLDADAALAM